VPPECRAPLTLGSRAAHTDERTALIAAASAQGRGGLDSLIGREDPIAPSPACSLAAASAQGRGGLDSLIGREDPIAPSPACSLLCRSSYLLYRLQRGEKGDEILTTMLAVPEVAQL
jgi:hypothetical protein